AVRIVAADVDLHAGLGLAGEPVDDALDRAAALHLDRHGLGLGPGLQRHAFLARAHVAVREDLEPVGALWRLHAERALRSGLLAARLLLAPGLLPAVVGAEPGRELLEGLLRLRVDDRPFQDGLLLEDDAQSGVAVRHLLREARARETRRGRVDVVGPLRHR